jgi:hypothetical protein
MGNGQMHMGMRVWLITDIGKVVLVLVMFIMTMPMRMLKPLVRVLMFVSLADVQPDTQRHQGRGYPEGQVRQFEQGFGERSRGAKDRCRGKRGEDRAGSRIHRMGTVQVRNKRLNNQCSAPSVAQSAQCLLHLHAGSS